MKPSSIFAPLHQRLPFLTLLACAIVGIVAGGYLHVSSSWWVAFAMLFGIPFLIRRSLIFFIPLTLCIFAGIHLWQSRESPARTLAEELDDHSLLVEVTGVTASQPRIFGDRSGFELKVSTMKRGGHTLMPGVRLAVDWIGTPPSYGDEIRLIGTLSNLDPPRNPGQFDFAAWQARNGIFTEVRLEHAIDGQILRHDRGNPLIALALHTRAWMSATLTVGILDPVVADLLTAMILGDSSSLPQSIQEQFRGTGTFHLFSVSGLHVAMLGVLLWYGLKILRFTRRTSVIVIIPALFFYALMTGFQPASVRSAVMASIVLAGFYVDRPATVLNSLCAAAFLILLYDTNELFNPGFQLSFTVVGAIVLFSKFFTGIFERPFRSDPFLPEKLIPPVQRFLLRQGRNFASLCGVSAAAWLGSLPLTLGYFHLVSLTSMPANLFAIPISFLIMGVAMLSLCTGMFSLWIAEVFNCANWMLTNGLLISVQFFASLPGSYCYLGPPPPRQQIAEITVLDFGSGGAAFLQTRDSAWMFDCGPRRTYDSILLRFLRSKGLLHLDGLLLTHGDAEHIGATLPMLDSCPPRMIIESPLDDRSPMRNGIRKELQHRGLAKSLHWAGDRLTLAPGVEMQILFPPRGTMRSSADDEAIVIHLTIGGTRILLMSDAGFVTENWLLEYAPDQLPSDILVKGSARAEPSGDPAFLDVVRPAAVIATASDFPVEEQIPPGWAKKVGQAGISLFRQDQTGAVTIRIFSHGYEITGFANKQRHTHFR